LFLNIIVALGTWFYYYRADWDLYAGSQTMFPGEVVQGPGFSQLQKVVSISKGYRER